MSKRRVGVILLALCVAGAYLTYLLLNPLRRSQEKIQNSLLELAPLGSSEDQVRAALDSVGMKHYPGRKDGDLLWRCRVDSRRHRRKCDLRRVRFVRQLGGVLGVSSCVPKQE